MIKKAPRKEPVRRTASRRRRAHYPLHPLKLHNNPKTPLHHNLLCLSSKPTAKKSSRAPSTPSFRRSKTRASCWRGEKETKFRLRTRNSKTRLANYGVSFQSLTPNRKAQQAQSMFGRTSSITSPNLTTIRPTPTVTVSSPTRRGACT